MTRRRSDVLLLTEEEEIDVFLIIDEYEKDGWRVVLNKELIDHTEYEEKYTYMLGFAKEEEV